MSLIPTGFAKSAAGGFYDTEISQSLRFNDDDSAYLSRTPASAGNRKTWTWSGWVKRGNLGGEQLIFNSRGDASNQGYIGFDNDKVSVRNWVGGSGTGLLVTAQVFRDVGAWGHLIVVYDSTNATANNRIRIYWNGSEITDFLSRANPSLNFDGYFNNTNQHWIVSEAGTGAYFDGYMAEVNFIDGTALDATSFGEFKSGVWIPKEYTGSYGTNGFYLDFDGTYYNDKSGNGNNWTANNLAATDVVLDSPTNNFATLNPLDKYEPNGAITLSEGNLKCENTSGVGETNIRSTFALSSGQWYAEFCPISGTSHGIGVVRQDVPLTTTGLTGTNAWFYYSYNGNLYHNGGISAYGNSYVNGDVIGVAIDVDTGKFWFAKNGVWQNSGNPVAGTNPVTTLGSGELLTLGLANGGATVVNQTNFGQDSSFAGNKTAQGNTDANGYGDFYYAPPSGYLALCTANLPDPVESIDPAQDGSPQDHFNTVLYTGNDTTNDINTVGFEPAWTWIKGRSAAHAHALFDQVRGARKVIFTNSSDDEYENASGTSLVSWDSSGFNLGSNGAGSPTNSSGTTYVAWNWKANGSGVSNTDGSITSTVSANTDAGFSIITYTGNGGTTSTIGHGLSQAPDIAIFKCRNANGTGWIVNSPSILGTGQNLILNSTAGKSYSASSDFVYGASTIQLDYGDWANGSGRTYVAYAFHSVDGFSKFGSYTGNGSTDNAFVYTGFAPAFVIIKKDGDGNNWLTHDIYRDTTNQNDVVLFPNDSSAEATNTGYGMDMLSNGFKIRASGGEIGSSGGTYIYMAFAEMPAKYSLGR